MINANEINKTNTVLLTISQYSSVSRKSRNSRYYNSDDYNTNIRDFLKPEVISNNRHNGYNLDCLLSRCFNFYVSQHNRYGNRIQKYRLSQIENRRNQTQSLEPVNLKNIQKEFKPFVKIFLLKKSECTTFFEQFDMEPRNATYYENEITQTQIDAIEYCLVLFDARNYYFDFESNRFSYYPFELFSYYENKFNEVKDMTNYFTDKYFPFTNESNSFCEGRQYIEYLDYRANSNISDIHYVLEENKALALEQLGTSPLGIFKFKSLLKGNDQPIESFKKYPAEAFFTGYGFLPYKTETNLYCYNSSNNLFLKFDFFGFLTGIQPSMIKKYVKAKNFIYDFFKKISNFQGTYLYDQEKYKELLKGIYKDHVKYSSLLKSIFPESQSSSSNLIIFENAQEIDSVSPDFSSLLLLNNNKNYSVLKSITTTITDLENKKTKAENDIADHNHRKNRASRIISDHESRIKQYQAYIEDSKKQIDTEQSFLKKADEELIRNKNSLLEYSNIIENLVPKKEEIYNKYKEEINSKSFTSGLEDKFTKNLNKKGIYIEDIVYQEKNNQETNYISYKNQPNIILETKQKFMIKENKFNLYKIVFKIIKPVIVKVDPVEKGEDCPKIAVGPLYVTLMSSEIELSPLTSNCIFGYEHNSKQIWIHPHTSARRINESNLDTFLTNFMQMKTRGCLGEASSAIYNAFEQQDPRQALLAAMTWITSANSADQWGKNWKYFPKLEELNQIDSEVNIQKINQNLISSSLTDPDLILENLFPNENIDPRMHSSELQIINSFIESLIPEPIEEEEEEEFNQNVEEDNNTTQNLRRVGHSNYTPFTTSQ